MLGLLLALAVFADDPLIAADARVATVAWMLQTKNLDLCSKRERLSGLVLQSLDQFAPADRAAVKVRYGLTDVPQIDAVVPGSQAAALELSPGDTIVAVDRMPVPLAGNGRASFATTAAAEAMIAKGLAASGGVTLTLGNGWDIRLNGDLGCASRVQLLPEKGINGGADGTYVQIGGKLYEFAQSDDELAAALAHELSHNILGHRERLDAAGVSRGLLAGIGKNGAQLRQAEFEADRLSVWLLARAGYRIEAIAPFWRRLGAKLPGGILSDGTHPGWGARIARIEAAVAEVEAQRAAGAPLVPPSQSGKAR